MTEREISVPVYTVANLWLTNRFRFSIGMRFNRSQMTSIARKEQKSTARDEVKVP